MTFMKYFIYFIHYFISDFKQLKNNGTLLPVPHKIFLKKKKRNDENEKTKNLEYQKSKKMCILAILFVLESSKVSVRYLSNIKKIKYFTSCTAMN